MIILQMFNLGFVTSLLQLFVIFLGIRYNFAQESSITFLPDVPRCIGDTVEMICYVVPPAGTSFIIDTALISLNGSTPVTVGTFNTLTSVDGIDTSRYTADSAGLSINTSRPGVRVNISDYQATDGSVVFGCAGLLSGAIASDVLISDSPQSLADPPSSPLVTLSQTDNNCSNTLISWSTPSSDRSITSYSVYRNGESIYDGSDNEYTDNTQLSISTVYEYSVIAVSCAGTSTAGVKSVTIGGYTLSSSSLSYDISDGSALFSWDLTPNQNTPLINISYLLSVYYTYTQDNTTTYNITQNIYLISSVTELDIIDVITQTNLSTNSGTFSSLRVCIQITEQCGGTFSGEALCDDYDSDFIPFVLLLAIGAIVGIAVGVLCLCCGCLLILTGIIILIIFCCVSKKKDSKKKSDSHELDEQTYSQVNKENKGSKKQPPVEEKKMEGLYADINHEFAKPNTLKKPEPIEETLYSQVHSIDGPSY